MTIKALLILIFTIVSVTVVPEGYAIFGFHFGSGSGNGSGTPSIARSGNIDPKVLELGLRAYSCVSKKGVSIKNNVLTIIDYSKPATEKRLWIVDMEKKKVTLEQLVAHGSGSGDYHKAKSFSNVNGSHQSSLGVFVTGETYNGKNGLSLRLQGLEKGINDKAERRAIVIHGASYASDNFLKRTGRLGRSWGCPAIDPRYTKETINQIKGGSVVFAYYPDKKWVNKSEYLNC